MSDHVLRCTLLSIAVIEFERLTKPAQGTDDENMTGVVATFEGFSLVAAAPRMGRGCGDCAAGGGMARSIAR